MNRNGQGLHARRRPRRVGFTLMELLLVLMILVVLASMAVTTFSGTQENALKSAAKGQVGLFKSAIDLYHFQTRQYPKSLTDLTKKPSDSRIADRWAGPYLSTSDIPLDPWDQEYRFTVPGKHNPDSFDVWSVGPDGQDGSDDDIGNWQ